MMWWLAPSGVWHALTRPRGHVRHRFYRVGRTSRAGVALLMVITSILLLTVLVTEIAHGATVRIRLAAQHRDEVKAEALAMTGVNLYRLILMASKQLGQNPMIQQAGQFLGVNGDSLWQMLPFINTQLMRMLLVSDGDLDEEDAIRYKRQGLSAEEEAESREGGSIRNNFLDFDGDFSASIQDEARFIYVGKLKAATFAELLESEPAKQLQGLMDKDEYRDWFYEQDIEPMELIGNLVDWTDADNTRLYQGGNEDAVYQQLDFPYRPKNAAFDSIQEIRLVDGWHLDGVWQRMGRHLTIYGAGKVNVNSAHRPVIRALLAAYVDGAYSEQYIDQSMEELMLLRGTPLAEGGIHFASAQHFKSFVESQLQASLPLRNEILNAVTTESQVFRVESSGEVGNARVQIKAVIDYGQDPTGRVVYWQIE